MFLVFRIKVNECWSKKLLKSLTPGEPFAFPECRFLEDLGRLAVGVQGRSRNIREIYVAFDRIMVPTKHGDNSF
jgi:hypothetical protein